MSAAVLLSVVAPSASAKGAKVDARASEAAKAFGTALDAAVPAETTSQPASRSETEKTAPADTHAASHDRDFSAVLEEAKLQPTAQMTPAPRIAMSDASDTAPTEERPDEEMPVIAVAIDGTIATNSPMTAPLATPAGSTTPGAASGIETKIGGNLVAPARSLGQTQPEYAPSAASSPTQGLLQRPEPSLLPSETGARSGRSSDEAAAMQAPGPTAASAAGGQTAGELSETFEAVLATQAVMDPAEGNAATRVAMAGVANAQKSAANDVTTTVTDAGATEDQGTQETKGPSAARAESPAPVTTGKFLPDPVAPALAVSPSLIDDYSSAAAPAGQASTGDIQTSGSGQTSQFSTLSNAAIQATAQIAAQIVKKLEGRSTRFEMALTPDDLGRVDVSLNIDDDGALQATLAFDNPVAATELRGRADELRRQLIEAGFTLADDALSFAERDPAGQGGAFHRDADPRSARAFGVASRMTAEADVSIQTPAWISLSLTPAGVDMKV